MTKTQIAALCFVLGALVPVIGIVVLGGGSLAMIVVGFFLALLLVITPICLWPREISRFIWSYSQAWEDGWYSFRYEARVAEEKLEAQRPSRGREKKFLTMLGPTELDVVSALKNMGMSEKKAQEIVREIAPQCSGDFEEMFRKAAGTHA